VQPWGQWGWPLILSAPERAVLELLDELPSRESFHQGDKLMEGLGNLRPRRLQDLLADCRSVKVKRLFFFFADRHGHAWLKRIDRKAVDLGRGKRMLVKGGRLYTVAEGLRSRSWARCFSSVTNARNAAPLRRERRPPTSVEGHRCFSKAQSGKVC
jgi:hypothetical protein